MFLFALIANASYVGRLLFPFLASVFQSAIMMKLKLSNILTLLFWHVCSILVRTTEWESIRANMPWLLDAIGCVALDLFVSFISSFFMQILY